MGPVANKNQFEKIQRLLQTGIDEGATVVIGGPAGRTASTRATSSSRPCSRT